NRVACRPAFPRVRLFIASENQKKTHGNSLSRNSKEGEPCDHGATTMPTSTMSQVIQQLRRAALPGGWADRTDAQLLEGFLAGGDESAFETLLHRHGPMVLGVCRRVLKNSHDAEDAFQATFLALVRKGASITKRDTVGG